MSATFAVPDSPPPRPSAAGDLVALGRITGTHALRGEVRIHLFNPDSTALQRGLAVFLRREDELRETRIVAVRPHKRIHITRLAGVDSIDDAEACIGFEVCLPLEALPELGPDEVYHFQLVGLRVETVAGEELGKIVEVLDLPANDVCIVRGKGREYLIPFIDDVVREVDLDGGRMLIEPLPGLFDQ